MFLGPRGNDMITRTITIFTVLFISVLAANAQSGQVTGRLTYPGEGIPPDLVLCITSSGAANKATYCSNSKASTLRAARITFRVDRRRANYQITLPPGAYLLYATTREMPGHKAYYNEFVRCGMESTCQSQKPIVLTVRASRTIKGITVGDFWNVG